MAKRAKEEKTDMVHWNISQYYLTSIWDLQIEFGLCLTNKDFEKANSILNNILMFTDPYLNSKTKQIVELQKDITFYFSKDYKNILYLAKQGSPENKLKAERIKSKFVVALYNINKLVIKTLSDQGALLLMIEKEDKMDTFKRIM